MNVPVFLSLIPTIAATLALGTSSASAAALVYEGFSNYNPGQLQGQSVSSSSVGVTGTFVTNAGAEADYTWNSTGLSFGPLQVSGGKGEFIRPNGEAAFLGLQYSGATVTGVLYSSYLISIQGGLNGPSNSGVRASISASTGSAGAYFQSFVESNAGTSPATAYQRTLSTTSLGAGTVAENPIALSTTFLVIGRYTNVGTPISSGLGLSGVATTYVLTLGQFQDFLGKGGLTDAALDNATVGLGSSSNVYARISNTYTPTATETYSFTSGIGVQFSVGNAGLNSNQNVAFDELRYGTTLADISPVPEPSSLLLLGASALLALTRRPRSRLTRTASAS